MTFLQNSAFARRTTVPVFLALLILGAAMVAQADPPRRWHTYGSPIRQGHHIEWQRSSARAPDGRVLVGWSDTRTGDRDLYGQMISPNGEQQWNPDSNAMAQFPQLRQEDGDMTYVTGGWIMAWIDFRHEDPEDTTGDVWAQKYNDAGEPQWPANNFTGVLVDGAPTMVNETTMRVAHDGNGGAIIAWEDPRRGDIADIIAQHVDANGNTWAQSLMVTDHENEQMGITADADGLGNMIVAWNDRRDPSNQNIFAAKITPQGTLPWGGVGGVMVCGANGSQDGVKICPDGSGGAYVVWRDQRNGPSRDLYMQRVNSTGASMWQTDGALVSGAPEDQNSPRVSVSMRSGVQDGALVIWEDQRVNGFVDETYCQKMSPTGVQLWTHDGVKLCGDAAPGGDGHMRTGGRQVSDLSGGGIFAWEDTRDDGNFLKCDLYAARLDSTGDFVWGESCGLPIAAAPRQQFAPLLRNDEGNGVFIIWDDTRQGSQSLRYQNLDLATGAFTIPGFPDGVTMIFGLDNDAVLPRSVPLTMGRVAVVWQDNRLGNGQLYYQVVDTVAADMIERQENGEVLVTDDSGELPNQVGHQVASDGNNGFFVTWEDARTGRSRIRAMHFNAAGERVSDPAGEVLFAGGPETRDQILAFCAADGEGGAYVAWSGYDPEFLIDVFVMRINSACEPQWATPVMLSTDPVNDDDMRAVIMSTNGCCIVAWKSGGSQQFNVSAARVCSDGSVSWNQEICNANGSQSNATAFPDGQGGAYFAWADARNFDTDNDIYAQHVNVSGTPTWTANGVLVVTALNSQNKPVIDIDTQSNLYVLWEDYRTGDNLDIYGQKLNSAGERQWPTTGKAIGVARQDQTQCDIETEWGEGLYAVWTDFRGAFTDMYGTHLTSSGNVADAYWAPDSGAVLCDFYQTQSNVTLSDDGHGALIAVWEDYRASGKDPLINIWANWINDFTVAVDEVRNVPLPATPELGQNFPNPFNPSTTLRFSLTNNERVDLTIYNLQGQKVKTLVDEVMTAGVYDVHFNAARLSSGVYFYRLTTPTFESVKKMTLLK